MPRLIKDIFADALELTPSERAKFVDRECASDPAAHAKVEELLRVHEGGDGFMDTPTAASATIHSGPHEGPGTRIGPYKLLQQIGEGGFGVVFLAEQEKPVQRRIALKIIKLGMDTRAVIARFEAERQALAMMDHPNIAKVLEAGATDTGRPYFVMDLVKGDAITHYCDTHNLSVDERLGLFQEVCHAVQHAHQKGIIHRDIKPGNVLVTVADGKPIPKVIDFGIAKATLSKLTEKTLFTEHRALIGTPEYMSPEQAEMTGVDIDTRSDIYSLGVLLYELLTGALPFDAKRLRSAAFGEIQRIIREEEPAKPSTRLSTLETLASVAAHRHTEPARLSKQVRGDLDWIVMKCLEKDRTRRYETANGLAADIKRHLSDEPVTAGAPSAGYKLRKFVKRNRARVIAVGIVAGALVLGVMGTTAGMVWALNEKDRANDEKAKATLAAQSEAAAKVQAQENEKNAIAEAKRARTISEFVTTALRASDARNSGREGGTEGAGQDMTILAAMDNAIKDIDSGRFTDDPETEAALRNTIGVILLNNGKYDKARPLLEQALAMRERLHKGDGPMVATSLADLALLYRCQSRYAQAEPLFTRALAIYEKVIGPDHPNVANTLDNLAQLYRHQGHYAQAEPLFKRALAISEKVLGPDHSSVAVSLNNLAGLYRAQGQLTQAEPLYTRALAIHEKAVGPDHPDVANTLNSLAVFYKDQCQYAHAESLYTRALAIHEKAFGPDHPAVAASLNNLASLYRDQGQYTQAEPLHLKALAIRERTLGPDHPDVAITMNSLAALYVAQGRYAQAEPLYRRALAIHEKAVGPDHPDVAKTLFGLAEFYIAQGQYAQIEPLYTRALAIYEKALGPDHPDVAATLNALAGLYRHQGQYAQAEPLYTRALAIRENVLGPDHPDVAASLNNLAGLHKAKGQYVQAEPLFTRALAIRERVLGPDHPLVASSLNNLASLYFAQGKHTQAEPLNVRALAIRERAFSPAHPDVLTSKASLAALYWRQNKLDKSVPLFEEVLKAEEAKLGRQHPDTLMDVLNLGVNYRDAGRLAEAIPLLEEAYRASKRYPQLDFSGPALLDAYTKAPDQSKPDSIARVVVLIQEMLADARGTLPKDSPQLAAQLASWGLTLLTQKAWNESEPLIREALTIREAKAPDAWTTFNTRSLLGGALLGQKKLAEAEPLLLDGYRGMKEREAAIPAQGKVRIPDALERLVRLYEAKDNEPEAAAWRSKLEASRAEQPKPATEGGK